MKLVGKWRRWGLVVVCVYRQAAPLPAQARITGICSPAEVARAVAQQQAIDGRRDR